MAKLLILPGVSTAETTAGGAHEPGDEDRRPSNQTYVRLITKGRCGRVAASGTDRK
jgi:hypothetical protein